MLTFSYNWLMAKLSFLTATFPDLFWAPSLNQTKSSNFKVLPHTAIKKRFCASISNEKSHSKNAAVETQLSKHSCRNATAKTQLPDAAVETQLTINPLSEAISSSDSLRFLPQLFFKNLKF